MLQPVKESWLNLGIEAMKEKLLSALNSFTVVSAIYVYQYFIIHIPKSCRQLSADVITYKNLTHFIASLYCQHLEESSVKIIKFTKVIFYIANKNKFIQHDRNSFIFFPHKNINSTKVILFMFDNFP